MFSKRPCLGIWHPSCQLNDEALNRLTFTDSPIARHKAMDCEEWVDSSDDNKIPSSSSEMHYPAICAKCREIMALTATRGSARKRKPNPKYEEKEEEEDVKVKQELSLITSELDFAEFNAEKLDYEGGEEDKHLDDGAGTEVKQDGLCENVFDEYDEEFIPDNHEESGEVPTEPKVEMWEEGGDNIDGRYVNLW